MMLLVTNIFMDRQAENQSLIGGSGEEFTVSGIADGVRRGDDNFSDGKQDLYIQLGKKEKL